jgi:hypothetical protein
VIHLHDVDVLLKLAGCDFLEELPALLRVSDEQIRILPTAVYKIRQLGMQKIYQEAVVTRAVAFCNAHAGLPDARDEAAFLRLVSLGDAVDAGEAVLFAVALAEPGSVIVSGDKRAMRCIGQLPEQDELRLGLQGRFICFEELLLRYRELHGFERLRARCCQGMEKDTVLQVVLGSGLGTTEEKAMEALLFHWQKLRREAGGLLVARRLVTDD